MKLQFNPEQDGLYQSFGLTVKRFYELYEYCYRAIWKQKDKAEGLALVSMFCNTPEELLVASVSYAKIDELPIHELMASTLGSSDKEAIENMQMKIKELAKEESGGEFHDMLLLMLRTIEHFQGIHKN